MNLPRSYDKAHLIVFSNDAKPFRENAENYCEAALQVGFDSATSYKQEDLKETQFWADNAGILEQPRGAGYWLWKPYILLEKLREVGPNDIVVYNDVGRYTPGSFSLFPEFPHAALELCARLPKRHIHGFSNNWGVQGHYTKRDCLILMDADNDIMLKAPQIAASLLIYMPTEENFSFLEHWLELARNPQLLTDTPDELDKPYPFFVDHRHDQAIGSILVHQRKMHHVDFSKKGINAARGEMERRYPDTRRMHIHIGYFSTIIDHALPEGFLESTEFIPEKVSHIFRNAIDGEDTQQLDPVIPTKTYHDNLQKMIAEGKFIPDRDHIIRMFSGYFPVISTQMHGLSKMTDIGSFWEYLEKSVHQRCQELPVDAKLRQAAEEAVGAVQDAYEAHPEIRETMLKQLIWSMLNGEAREAVKKAQKERKISGRDSALTALLDNGVREEMIGEEGIRRRHVPAWRERINNDLLAWFAAFSQDEPKDEEGSAQPSDAQVVDSAEA